MVTHPEETTTIFITQTNKGLMYSVVPKNKTSEEAKISEKGGLWLIEMGGEILVSDIPLDHIMDLIPIPPSV